ncbi:MAG: NAD(P)H-dependent oxidoreductase [Lachnospiraceae bacterium]|nr:NAD(P)H-dependent oxidoreductase [Lachnospiraceae bacterium]
MSKILIAYFTLPGETYSGGTIIKVEKGYTETAAEYISEATGGDLYRIKQKRTYSTDHYEMIEEAKAEMESGELPDIEDIPDNLADYDTVVLAFPNWWNSLPMPVVTFLDRADLSGKKIVAFNTSGGGGFGNSMNVIRQYAPNSEIVQGLTLQGAFIENAKNVIQYWAKDEILS